MGPVSEAVLKEGEHFTLDDVKNLPTNLPASQREYRDPFWLTDCKRSHCLQDIIKEIPFFLCLSSVRRW